MPLPSPFELPSINHGYGMRDLARIYDPDDHPAVWYRRAMYQPAPMFPPALEQDELAQFQSTLEKESLGQKLLSGVHKIGGLLDKPFRTIRAGIAGAANLLGVHEALGAPKPTYNQSELAAFLPFSDTLGITNEKNATQSRELVGGGRKNPTESWDRYDTAGLIADLLLGFKAFPKFGAKVRPSSNSFRQEVAGIARPQVYGQGFGATLTPEAKILGQYEALPVRATERLAGIDAANPLNPGLIQKLESTLNPYGPFPAGVKPNLGPNPTGLRDILDRISAGEHVPLQGVAELPFNLGVVGSKPGLSRAAWQSILFPFAGVPELPGASGLAAGGLPKAGETAQWLRDNAPGRTFFRKLLDPRAGSQPGATGQYVHENIANPRLQEAGHEAGMFGAQMGDEFLGAGGFRSVRQMDRYKDILNDLAENRITRAAAEAGMMARGMPARRAAHLVQMSDDAFQQGRTLDDLAYDALTARGVIQAPKIKNHVHRDYVPASPRAEIGGSAPTVGIMPQAGLPRPFEVPGTSTNIWIESIMDPEMVQGGLGLRGTIAKIRTKPWAAGMTPSDIKKMAKQLQSVDPAHALLGKDPFPAAAPVRMVGGYTGQLMGLAGANVMHDTLAMYAIPGSHIVAGEAPHHVSVVVALKKIANQQGFGLDMKKAMTFLADRMNAYRPGAFRVGPKDMMHWYVPKDLPDAIGNQLRLAQSPESKHILMRGLDALLGSAKNLMTTPFPDYQMANGIGQFFQNVLEGISLKNYGRAKSLLGGGTIPGVARALGMNVSDDVASQILRQEVKATTVATPAGGIGRELHSSFAPDPGSAQTLLPIDKPGSLVGVEPWLQKGAGNLFAMRGVYDPQAVGGVGASLGNAARTRFLPLRALEGAATYMDRLNQVAHYLGRRIDDGLSPLTARMSTKSAHFGIDTLTDFERSYMTKAFLFYTWPKGIVQMIARKSVEDPGKIMALTKLSGFSEDSNPYIPPTLRDRLQLPVGEAKEWANPDSGRSELRQRFLQILPALPHEEALRWLNSTPGPSGVSTAASVPVNAYRNLLSNLRPEIRAAMELDRGRSFFGEQELNERRALREYATPPIKGQGVGDYISRITRSIQNASDEGIPWDTVLRYSPLSRLYNAFERMESGMQRGLGIGELVRGELGILKPRMVDLRGAREREHREYIERMLAPYGQGDPTQGFRIRDEADYARLLQDPQAVLMLRAFRAMQQNNTERGLQRDIERAANIERALAGGFEPGPRLAPQFRMAQLRAPIARDQLEMLENNREWRRMTGGLPLPNPLNALLRAEGRFHRMDMSDFIYGGE